MTFFHMKHKTKLKHKRNVVLYNPHDLDNPHHLESGIGHVNDINNTLTAQYCHTELGNTLFLAHITTNEYAARYITSLLQKILLLCS